MSRLEIWEADEAQAAALSWPDVYFTPAYGRAIAGWLGQRWLLASWDKTILFPFLLRPIDGETSGYEAASPYGYSGTAAVSELPGPEWELFRKAWRRQAPGLGVVAEFQRLSPFVVDPDRLAAADGGLQIRRHNEIVVVDCRDLDHYWSSATKSVRNRVRRAERAGFRCIITPLTEEDVEDPDGFRSVYEATMDRVEADDAFSFDEDYYLTLVRGLRGAVHLARVVDGDATVAAGIFFVWNRVLHCHLGGARADARTRGATVFRLHEQIRWAHEHGMEQVNLGGGRRPGDSLFSFKASFGGSLLPFSVATADLARG